MQHIRHKSVQVVVLAVNQSYKLFGLPQIIMMRSMEPCKLDKQQPFTTEDNGLQFTVSYCLIKFIRHQYF